MQHKDIFDYATMLLKIDKLAKELHEACLYKRYEDVPSMCAELVVEARMLRGWAIDAKEKRDGTRSAI